MTPRTTAWRRLTGRSRRARNPLRRRSDIIEAWLLPAAVVAFLALGPLVVSGAASWIHSDTVAAQHAQQSWHRVSAVLLAGAPGPMMTDARADAWIVWTPARWTLDGKPQRGQVPVAAGTATGSVVPVWLDRSGRVQQPPLTTDQELERVIVSAGIMLTALAVFLTMLTWAIRRLLDWRRLASWETAWLSVGPLWSRQR